MGAVVFVGGRLFTGTRLVEALACEDGRVVAAGTRRAVLRGRPTGAERVDLGGHLAVPGLIDAHLHLLESVRLEEGVDLAGVRDALELLEKVGRAAAAGPDRPVFGTGWDEERMDGRRLPSLRELDRRVPERPAALLRVCTHVGLVNSRALEALGFDDASPDPPGGRLGRDASGRLNGLLYERALDGVAPLLEPFYAERDELLRATLERWAALGLTTVAAMSASPLEARLLSRASREGGLPVRVAVYFRRPGAEALGPLLREARAPDVVPVGAKLVADGSLGARTAWLGAPYSDAPGSSGGPLLSDDELLREGSAAEAAGLQLAVHAIGDRAVSKALDLFERVAPARPPRIEHASLVPPPLVDRLARAAPGVVVQPRFVDSDRWIGARLGRERSRHAYPFRTLLARGLTLAGSSDAPVESVDPWTGLRAAVVRADGRPEEAVDALAALRMYTLNAGRVLGHPEWGSLEPGGCADLLELSAPTLEAAIGRGAGAVTRVYRAARAVGPGPRAGGGRAPRTA